VAPFAAVAALLLTGIPTEMIANPIFQRMTEIRPQDYAIWLASGLLGGLIAATYLGGSRRGSALAPGGTDGRGVIGGGALAYLAIGCPVCNKLVVLLLGSGGAMTFFAPAQLYLGIASLLLLGATLVVRARAINRTCQVGLARRPAGSEAAPLSLPDN
jgi:hypothetical protein